MLNWISDRLKTEVARNFIAMLALIVASAALFLSWLGFSYQYKDQISSVLAVTSGSSEVSFVDMKDNEGRLTGTYTVDAQGYFQLTVFNSGNRAISINNVIVYVQPGDFKTLTGVTPTPPCTFRIGSVIVYGDGSSLRLDARIVEPGRIASIPLRFSWFRKTDPSNDVKQGIVCIRVQAYDYIGRFAQLQFPIGIVLVAQGNKFSDTSVPTSAFSLPNGAEKNTDMRRLF